MPKKNFYDQLKIPDETRPFVKKALGATLRKLRKEGYLKEEETNDCKILRFCDLRFCLKNDKFLYASKSGNFSDLSSASEFPLYLSRKSWAEKNFPKFSSYVGSEFARIFDECCEGKCSLTSKQQKAAVILATSMASKVKEGNYPRLVGKMLWNMLDEQALSYTLRTRYYASTSRDYTYIAHNLDEVSGLMQATPAVVTFWLGLLRSELITAVNYKTENIVQDVRGYLNRIDCCSNRIWRMICGMPPYWANVFASAMVQRRGRPFWALKMMAEIGEMPTYTALRSFVFYGYSSLADRPVTHDFAFFPEIFSQEKTNSKLTRRDVEIAVPFYRAAFRQSKQEKKNFFSSSVPTVLDFLSRSNITTLDANQRKASFKWYQAQRDAWHREMNAYQRRNRGFRYATPCSVDTEDSSWTSLVERQFIDGYEVVPLISSQDLAEEGKAMNHCVKSYVRDCVINVSRIFSIRQNGERLATIEIKPIVQEAKREWDFNKMKFNIIAPEKVSWQIQQIRGPSNADVANTTVRKVARRIAELYNEVATKQVEKTNEVEELVAS